MLSRLYEARDNAEAMAGEEDAERVASDLGADALKVLKLGRSFSEDMYAALNDDFNTSKAIGHLFSLARAVNRFSAHKKARRNAAGLNLLSAVVALASVTLFFLRGVTARPKPARRKLLARVRQQRHKPSSFDCLCYDVLAGGRTTRLAASNNPPVAINQLFEHLHVFIIHVHRTWPFAINEQRIFFLRSSGKLLSLSRFCVSWSHAANFLATRA